MAAPAILSVRDALVTFGKKPLFKNLTFNIHQGDRICLVGKNGVGKTTLMHIIDGTKELDGGERWEQPGLRVGYLQQDVKPNPEQTVYDYIFSALPKDKQTEEYSYMVGMVTAPFELHTHDTMDSLSGGELRRASLAHALVEEPDVLLLDEPTNHLDLTAIEWLEDFLKYQYRGTLLCVSHDKAFLANISDKVFWLDRGTIKTCPHGFSRFDEWSTQLLEQEERELRNRERALAVEVEWASRGVKARRKRNVRRVEEMQTERESLKADKSLYNKTMRKIDLEPVEPSQVSNIVAEFYRVNKTFKADHATRKILDNFNLRIMRGDRIGLLGKNGSGKTSFLSLLTGEIQPDSGKIKRAHNIEFSYFDQKRRDLQDKFSMKKTLAPGGGDYVDVGGKPRHVCGYLKDFMFDPQASHDLVGTLSGGQKNRLMLAKVLANPGNFLILDEPTNDLDMDTLDMLEDILSKYKGTLIVVSHDRDFLDQTVSKVLAFEGDGDIEGYIGGYSDYLEAKQAKNPQETLPVKEVSKVKKEKRPHAGPPPQKESSTKLSYKLQYELEQLPITIEKLESEIAALHNKLSDSSLYTKSPKEFDKYTRRVGSAQKELQTAMERWMELEEMQKG